MTENDRDRKPDVPHTAPSDLASGTRHPGRARPPQGRGRSSASGDPNWLLVGEIVGALGLRGELKVRPETDFPDRFVDTPTLYLGPNHTPRRVASARVLRGNQVTVQLEGVEDATAAGKLRGTLLYVPMSEAVALPPDQFYLHDVVGLRAERPDGTVLGTITDVLTGPGNDVYVVRAAGKGQEVLVPAVKEMIKRVDVAGGVVVMEPIAGLFDEGFETAE